MKIQDPCLSCLVRQTVQVADMTLLDNKKRPALYREMFRTLSEMDFNEPAPVPFGKIFRIAADAVGCDDPYREIRTACDQLMLSILPDLRLQISKSEDPLQTALRLAAAGNVIDYSIPASLTTDKILDTMRQAAEKPFVLDDSARLCREIRAARSLMLIGDNCGEIVLDKLLAETCLAVNPDLTIFYVVRGAPVINDVTEEEAHTVGMDAFATVLNAGCPMPGMVLSACSARCREAWLSCDVRVAKGQGNFECLDENRAGRDLYCLLLAKCVNIADAFHVAPYSPVCSLLPAEV